VRPLPLALVLCIGCAGALHERLQPPAVSVADTVEHGVGVFDGDGLVRLFEQWWRPAGKPPRAVVVILHGYKDHSTRYSELADRLAQHGIAVRAYDLRGQGSSGGRRDYVEGFDEFLEDLDIFMKSVRAREPSGKIFMLGQGLGGLIAVDYVLKRKPQLDGLILSAPDLEYQGVPRPFIKMFGAIMPLVATYSLDSSKVSSDPAVLKARASDPLITEGNGTARMESEVLSTQDYVGEHVGELQLPLYVVAGSSDQISPAQTAKHFVDDAASPDKDFQIYVRLFHDLLHEPEKEVVMTDISEWIDKHIPGSAADGAQTEPPKRVIEWTPP
jgi:acylglycerol lipase